MNKDETEPHNKVNELLDQMSSFVVMALDWLTRFVISNWATVVTSAITLMRSLRLFISVAHRRLGSSILLSGDSHIQG